METRASYFLVGLFVLLSSIGLAGFAVWLAKTDVDRSYGFYQIVFKGSVGGLQEGSQVQYRGVPVGRVREIRIDPDDVSQVLATVEVDALTPVKTDTRAQLAMQGITGIANIELLGGSNASDVLAATEGHRLPRIVATPSAIEQVFQSTPELLANAVTLLESLGKLASPENVQAISTILRDLGAVTASLAESRDELEILLKEGATASQEVSRAASGAGAAITEIGALATALREQANNLGESGTATVKDVGATAQALRNLTWRFDRTLEGLQRPLDDFGQSGLYDFTEMVREMRTLVSSLTRITKDFERDPAGFLIGGSQRGFVPQ